MKPTLPEEFLAYQLTPFFADFPSSTGIADVSTLQGYLRSKWGQMLWNNYGLIFYQFTSKGSEESFKILALKIIKSQAISAIYT